MNINVNSYLHYLEHFKEFTFVPCIYCPGNCITECPTFLSTRNLLFSPVGYVRSKEIADKCLQCWRCVFNCPIEYPLPILIDTYKQKENYFFSYKILSENEKYLIGESPYKKQMIDLAHILDIGVISLIENNDFSGEENIFSFNKDRLIAFSPETAFLLGIPHYSEVLNNYLKDLNLSIKLHIPCLLLPRKDRIINSLNESGISIVDIDYKTCIKQVHKDIVSYYSLCPKIQDYNGYSLDQFLAEVLNK